MTSERLIFFISLLLAIILYVGNSLATEYFWYWRFRWFDIPMHLLGGLLVGLIGPVLWRLASGRSIRPSNLNWTAIMVTSLVAAMIIGVARELFEFGVDRFYGLHLGLKSLHLMQLGWRDTSSDLVDDAIGGLMAGMASFYLWRKKLN